DSNFFYVKSGIDAGLALPQQPHPGAALHRREPERHAARGGEQGRHHRARGAADRRRPRRIGLRRTRAAGPAQPPPRRRSRAASPCRPGGSRAPGAARPLRGGTWRSPPINAPSLARRTDAVLELAVVLGLVVVTERPGDEPVGADRPLLEAGDAHLFAR